LFLSRFKEIEELTSVISVDVDVYVGAVESREFELWITASSDGANSVGGFGEFGGFEGSLAAGVFSIDNLIRRFSTRLG